MLWVRCTGETTPGGKELIRIFVPRGGGGTDTGPAPGSGSVAATGAGAPLVDQIS
jgi:hypothetical protein